MLQDSGGSLCDSCALFLRSGRLLHFFLRRFFRAGLIDICGGRVLDEPSYGGQKILRKFRTSNGTNALNRREVFWGRRQFLNHLFQCGVGTDLESLRASSLAQLLSDAPQLLVESRVSLSSCKKERTLS